MRDPDRADALAQALQKHANHLLLPLAAAADAFSRIEGWKTLCYARQSDYAKEKLDRTGRWLRLVAQLGRAIHACPELGDAVTGGDGGDALGLVKSTLVARVATGETASTWIERARAVGVRQLECDVKEACNAMSETTSQRGKVRVADRLVSPPSIGAPIEELLADSRERVRIHLPRAVRAAFDEARDLHRAVNGGEATLASFVEALVADTLAGVDAGFVDEQDDQGLEHVMPTSRGPSTERRESELDQSREPFSEQDTSSHAVLRDAEAMLRRARRLFALAGTGDAHALHRQLCQLARIEDEIQRTQAQLLLAMKRWNCFSGRGWLGGHLRFDSVGHYARERLGMTRATAERLVRLARGLEQHRELARAVERRQVSQTKAGLLLRVFGRREAWLPDDIDAQREWIRHSERATVRRLRQEVRQRRREGDLDEGDRHARPLPDRQWLDSVSRRPGRSFERVIQYGASALRPDRQWTALLLVLEPELADAFSDALRMSRNAVAYERAALRGLVADDGRSCGEGFRLGVNSPSDVSGDSSGVLSGVLSGVARRAKTEARRAKTEARRAKTEARDEPFSASEGSPTRRVGHAAPWEGLMRMLLGFVATHDPPQKSTSRTKIYERDGYRCTAPGCTSRSNLEDHHIKYRSHLGTDDPWNRTTLCAFHHRRGEHAHLMRVRGRAPDSLMFRMGVGDAARMYRNDLRVS